jgi:hypothetical protein
MLQLFEWDILNQGNIISIRNFDGSEAEAIDYKSVKYKGKIYTFNQWGILVTGWSAVNIYEWTMLKDKGKTLDQLRRERIIIEENIGI